MSAAAADALSRLPGIATALYPQGEPLLLAKGRPSAYKPLFPEFTTRVVFSGDPTPPFQESTP